MVTNYKQAKEDVLKIYSECLPIISEVKKGKDTTFDSSIEALENQAKDIRDDKFLLMIVGEAKSGKSTFINAYLGEEILPMDVKQCTSAIVEIRYGERFILRATYADDSVKVIESENEIKAFLTENAALDDEYRDIPVPTININILMAYKGKNPPSAIIKDLLEGIKGDNIHHLSQTDYEEKVRNYIKEKTPIWNTIVKKIEIEYPFADTDMRGIEIVDTPGVNAKGHVGEITEEYIVKANAVMFLKSIVGAALEANSFKDFLNTASAGRNRNAMFLVLTRAANETPDNISRLYDEALKQFPDINEKQVVYIDSKVELFYNKIKHLSQEELSAYIMPLLVDKKIEPFLALPWLTSNGRKDEYIKQLRELSNFVEIEKALNLFAHKAQYIALSEFLHRLISVLDKISAKLMEEKGYYEQKKKDPIELSIQLREVKDNLEDLGRRMHEKVDEITDSYTLPDGFIAATANSVIDVYKQVIAEINPNATDSVDRLEAASYARIDAFQVFRDELSKKLIAECDAALVALSDKSGIPYPQTIKPDVTKQEIKSYKEETYKNESKKIIEYTTGKTFKQTKQKSGFSQQRYFEIVRDNIKERIENIRNQAIADLREFVGKATKLYKAELERNIRIKRSEYNEILNEKKTAEEILDTIQQICDLLETITPLTTRIIALKGGIDANV